MPIYLFLMHFQSKLIIILKLHNARISCFKGQKQFENKNKQEC